MHPYYYAARPQRIDVFCDRWLHSSVRTSKDDIRLHSKALSHNGGDLVFEVGLKIA